MYDLYSLDVLFDSTTDAGDLKLNTIPTFCTVYLLPWFVNINILLSNMHISHIFYLL